MHDARLAVGAQVHVVRRLGRTSSRHLRTVVRHTPTTVILDSGERFVRKGDSYSLRPAYLDYVTTLEVVG